MSMVPALPVVRSDRPRHVPAQAPPAGEWLPAIEAILAGTRPFGVHYQPLVDLQRGAVAGYEALARFDGPPQAGPDRWFAAAEQLGLGTALEARTLAAALEDLPALPGNAFLTVNVSPEFLASPEWERLFAGRGRLDRLVVEITENAAIENYEDARRALEHARSRGAFLAVDDAGSGYASLQHVMRLRPDFVKLDREFIAGCDADPARIAMIEAMGTVAGQLDAWIVAEGVETENELRLLMRLGVPLAQGWLLGRPRPGWTEVSDAARQVLAGQQRRAADLGTAAALLEDWPAVVHRDRLPDAAFRLTLVLDPDGRPRGWLGPGVAPHHSRPLTVKTTTALHALARRAMTRHEAMRFVPVVCTDDEGRYVGVVRIEQLVGWLARTTRP